MIGVALGFTLALLGGATWLLVTNTRAWHDRYHRDGLQLMCDRCVRDWERR